MKRLTMLIACCVLLACGGGTSGSSSTGGFVDKNIDEIVRDENGLPLALATVEAISTGEKFKTDENGSLSVKAPLQVTGHNNFLITTPDERVYVLQIDVSVVEDQDGRKVRTGEPSMYRQIEHFRYGRWELKARVAGAKCDTGFFSAYPTFKDPEEARRWRGSSDSAVRSMGIFNSAFDEVIGLPRGAQCVLEVEVLQDGAVVPGMRYNAKIGVCGEVVRFEPFAEGTSDENGRIALPLRRNNTGVCVYDFQIPGWGDLKLGAALDIIPMEQAEIPISPNRP